MHSVQLQNNSRPTSPRSNWASIVKRTGTVKMESNNRNSDKKQTEQEQIPEASFKHHRGGSSASGVSSVSDSDVRYLNNVENLNNQESENSSQTFEEGSSADEREHIIKTVNDAIDTSGKTQENQQNVAMYNNTEPHLKSVVIEHQDEDSDEQSTESSSDNEKTVTTKYKYHRQTHKNSSGDEWITSTVLGINEDTDKSKKTMPLQDIQSVPTVLPLYASSGHNIPVLQASNSYPCTSQTINTTNSSIPNTNAAQTAPIVNNLVNHGPFMNMNAYTAINVPNMMYYSAASPRNTAVPQGNNVMMKQDGVFYSMQYNPAIPQAYTMCAPFQAYTNPNTQQPLQQTSNVQETNFLSKKDIVGSSFRWV